MSGRLIDNTGFFDAKEVDHSVDGMLEKMLEKFPKYYDNARALGLITG